MLRSVLVVYDIQNTSISSVGQDFLCDSKLFQFIIKKNLRLPAVAHNIAAVI